MSKLLILLPIVFLILMVVPVYGVPPFTPLTSSTSTKQLVILYPAAEDFVQYQYVKFHFHVMNSSGYNLNSTSGEVNCTVHVYNESDNHVLREPAKPDSEDLYFLVNTNITGVFNYNIWCYSKPSNEAGYLSSYYTITAGGISTMENNTSLLSFFIITFITILCVGIAFFIPREIFLNNVFVWIGSKVLFFSIGIFLMISNIAIVRELISQFGGNMYLLGLIDRNFRAVIFMSYTSIVLFVVSFIWYIISLIYSYVKIKNRRPYESKNI